MLILMQYMKPTNSYIICGTPRCGSHFLSEVLANTGVAGNPDEYFMTDLQGRLQNESGNIAEQTGPKTLVEFRDFVLNVGSTPNGVFGIVIFWDYVHYIWQHYRQLPSYQGLSLPQTLNKLFCAPRYIWLTRRDKVRQAVSLAKAIQTDQWRKTAVEPSLPPSSLTFDFVEIEFRRQQLATRDNAWQTFFTTNHITPFIVSYEELIHAPEQTALQILDFLAIPRPQESNVGGRLLCKQADSLSENWVAQYERIRQARFFTLHYTALRLIKHLRRVSIRQALRP